MDDFEEKIREITIGVDRFISTPETVEKMIKQGYPISKIPPLSMEESIEKLFEDRKKDAVARAKNVPVSPTVQQPNIQALYNEIRECVILGLYGAAITLSGILIEFTLKYASYIRELGGFGSYDSTKWDKFEQMTFGTVINRAYKDKLLTQDMKNGLEKFKDDYRNPYSHFNIKKITRGIVWRNVKIVNIETKEIETKNIRAEDDPVIQAQAKPFVDEQDVFKVVKYTDAVVRSLLSQLSTS